MPASLAGKLEIFNMALGFCGCRTVGSPNERTPEAIQCGLFWDRARRSALRDYPWSWATRRFRLPEKDLPEVYASEWRHAYGLPDGVLRVMRVHKPRMRGDYLEPFRLERGEEGEIILCDVPQAMATCIVDVEDMTTWDDSFCLCLARKLACLIVVPLLKNSSGKVSELEQLYHASLPQTAGLDSAERRGEQQPDSWLAARG